MGKNAKISGLFVVITLVIFVLVGYLGFRTIGHEALLAQQRMDELVQGRLGATEDFVMVLLQQKETHLDAVADYMQLDENALKAIVEKDADIDQIFVLQQGKLVYPVLGESTSLKSRGFIEEIAFVIDDPSVLFAHSVKSEDSMPRSGWFSGTGVSGPLLIYWRNQGDRTIGFRVSYVKLLSDVINRGEFFYSDGVVEVLENDRLLYRSDSLQFAAADSVKPTGDVKQLGVKYLPYPLTGWQVRYEGKPAEVSAIYFWGVALVLVFLMSIGFVVYRIYREYTQTRREVLQQVNFVSQVSHELKTPLTNITLYAELLQEELKDSGDEDGERSVGVIISEGQRLSRLIQNILSFTRPSKVHVQEIDVSELMGQIGQTFEPLFATKGVDLVLNVGEAVMLETDRDRVSQIICNFLSNAEKYAASGKRVDLSVKQGSDHVDIDVRDYGPGIPDAEHQEVFRPFYRLHSSITEGVSGTGIGLTITQQLAVSLGGEVFVRSMEPGVCFTLRLERFFHKDGQLLGSRV